MPRWGDLLGALGTIPPPAFEATAFTPLLLASVAIWGPSRVPAPWTIPVVSAFARKTVSVKSMIVKVSA